MEKERHSKLQFRIDLVLTVLFLLTIFYFLYATIVYENGLWGHTFYFDYVSQFLEDPTDYSAWDLIEASKNSLDNFISENIHGTKTLGRVNSAFQFALGKKMVNTGGTQMIRLNSGHLFDMQDKMSIESAERDILDMRAIVPEGTPFVYVYEHSTLYDEAAQMPSGYEFLNYSIRSADELVQRLRADGVEVIDSRDIFAESGATLEEFLLYTDRHWSTRAAMIVAQRVAEYVQEATGVAFATERLDLEQFDTQVYPKLFLGQYGQRLGPGLVDPDDITVYTPKYDTNIHRYTVYRSEITDVEGPFETVNIRWDTLYPDEGVTWNTRAYHDYGLTENYEIYSNEAGADCTILLLKDSFSAPVGRFLSLVANEVYAVDLRDRTISLQEWIDKSNPDIVVLAYSLQMLRAEEYAFE